MLTMPGIDEVVFRDLPAPLPSDAPSMAAKRAMNQAFDRAKSPNIVLLTLTDASGLNPADEAAYRKVVDTLAANAPGAITAADGAASSPDRMIGTDNKSWIVPLTIPGEFGSPAATDAYRRIASTVQGAVAHTSLTADFLGPESTAPNTAIVGPSHTHLLEIAAVAIALTILLIVYRSLLSALLLQCPTIVAIVLARNIIAGLARDGLPGSDQAVTLATTAMFAAGLAHTLLLVGRYHELLQSGAAPQDAVRRTMTTTGRAVAASAATAIVVLTGVTFARLGALSTLGPILGIAWAIGAMSTLTLLPALLVLAGRRGWTPSVHAGPARSWRLLTVSVIRHPVGHLAAAALVLVTLAACTGFVRADYTDMQVFSAGTTTGRPAAAVDYVIVQSAHDLRSPQTLADLELMARRVSQVPGVAAVFGVTRPAGQVPQQAKVSYQAAEIGAQLSGAASDIANANGQLDSLSRGSRLLADTIAKAVGTINQVLGTFQVLVTALTDLEQQVGGETSLKQQIASLGPALETLRSMGAAFGLHADGQQTFADVLTPVVDGLSASPVCDANPSCTSTRAQLQSLVQGPDNGSTSEIDGLGRALIHLSPNADTSRLISDVQRMADALVNALRSLGAQGVASLQQQLSTAGVGANGLAQGSQQLATQIDTLVDQTKQMGAGLRQSAAILSALWKNASPASMAGFNASPEVMAGPAVKSIAAMTVSEDGHTVRYLVQSNLKPSSPAAADQADALLSAARSAQPNTTLAGAAVSLSGKSAVNRDIRDHYHHDLRYIGALVACVMLGALALCLRAVVAPLYLVGSSTAAYLAALAITTVVTNCFLHRHVWAEAPVAACVVLAITSFGHHLLLLRRVRQRSPKPLRSITINVVASSGRTIAMAGLVSAAVMFGLLFSGSVALAQVGLIVGIGLLIDTLVVRAVILPALVTLLGAAGWWPGGVLAGLRHRHRQRRGALAAVQHAKTPVAPALKPVFTRLSRRSFV